MVRRFDACRLDAHQKLDNGYLKADAAITRVGVFNYRNGDGTVRRELRLPSEVFRADALGSFDGVALTNNHPPVQLDTKNTHQFQVGTVGNVRVDGDKVSSLITVTDESAIADVESGKTQLSCGYDCELETVPGVTDGSEGLPAGLRYDAIQRNIRGNHVALVTKGRAGPDVGLRLDSDDAVLDESTGNAKPEEKQMAQRKIDGVDIEFSEQGAQAIDKLTAKADEAVELAESYRKDLEKEKARADQATEEASQARKDAEAVTSHESIQTAVKARLDLERNAGKYLKNDVKLDAMSDDEVKRAVVVAVSPAAAEKLDGCDAAYLQARFDQVLESAPSVKKDGFAPQPTGRTDVAPERSADKARQEMIKRHRDAWKTPVQGEA